MGSFNVTCAITRCVLNSGCEVVAFPIIKKGCNLGYSTENFSPVLPAIHGVYDDYGFIKHIDDRNDPLVIEVYTDFYNRYINKENKPIEGKSINMIFEDLAYVPTLKDKCSSSSHRSIDSYSLEMMYVNANVYHALIDEMSNRIPYGKEDIIFNLQLNRLLELVTKIANIHIDCVDRYYKYHCDLTRYICNTQTIIENKIINELVDGVDELCNILAKELMFHMALNYMNVQIHPTNKTQSEEFFLQDMVSGLTSEIIFDKVSWCESGTTVKDLKDSLHFFK
jgi:hypothetical protein